MVNSQPVPSGRPALSAERALDAPFRGLRVTSFGWFWAAPLLGHLLADLGAEVIRVESWTNPCQTRMTSKAMTDTAGESFFVHNVMRSQRSVSLSFDRPEAMAIARDLARQSDVVVENFRPGVVDRLGVGYQQIRRVRPDVVYLSLSAYGQTGPLRKASGLGSNLASVTGMDGLQGYGAGEPRSFAVAILDPFNGALAAFALMSALRHRRLTGEGQYVDMAQAESAIAMFGAPVLDYVFNRRVHHPMGNRDAAMAPHGVYPCRGDDAWVSIAVATEEEWAGLCAAMGRPDWTNAPRFADQYRRLRRQDELDSLIGDWTRRRGAYEIAFLLQRHGVAAFPAMSGAQLFTDPHFQERKSWVEVQHPYGIEQIYGVHWKMSETPGRVRRASPLLGMDNGYVFGEVLGMAEEEIIRLEERQVIY